MGSIAPPWQEAIPYSKDVYTQLHSIRMLHGGEVGHRWDKRASASSSFSLLMLLFLHSVFSDRLPPPRVYSKRFIDFLTSCYFSSLRLFFPELSEVRGDCCYARCISVLWSLELHVCWNNVAKAQTYYKPNRNFQVITYHWVTESKTV